VIPANPNWTDVQLKFASYTSSNTCNPYGIAFVQVGAVYPFTGQYVIADSNSFGSGPNWNSNTYGYYLYLGFGTSASASLLSSLGSNVSYLVFFVYNDSDVQVDGSFEFNWLSNGPSNVSFSTF
jgi:hypothetical protein